MMSARMLCMMKHRLCQAVSDRVRGSHGICSLREMVEGDVLEPSPRVSGPLCLLSLSPPHTGANLWPRLDAPAEGITALPLKMRLEREIERAVDCREHSYFH